MKKSFRFENLPHGAGAVIGHFVRSIYMTAIMRPAIIGMSVNDLGLFQRIPQNSVIVSDIVWGLIGKKYEINPDVLTDDRVIGESDLGTVWGVTVPLNGVKDITTDLFSGVMTTSSRLIVQLLQEQDIVVTLYIMEVCGNVKEELSSACLQEVLHERSNTVAPIACSGTRAMNCWHKIHTNKFTEDLEIFIEGNDLTFDDDFEAFKEIIGKYAVDIVNEIIPQ